MNAKPIRAKRILPWVAVVVLAALAYAWTFGLWPRYFDIEWDEEVQLHDGRVIVVNIKRTFERLSSLNRWEGVHRDTEIRFDAGGAIGRFTTKFQRYDISLLEHRDGRWFIGLVQTTGTPPIIWVDFENPFLVLEADGRWRKESLANFPKEFVRYNVMPLTPDSKGVAKFTGTFLTSTKKMKHWSQFPRGAGDDGNIRRRKSSTQGEMK